MSHQAPSVEEIRAALGPDADRVTIHPPHPRLPDALRVTVNETASIHTLPGWGAAIARTLRAAKYRVEVDGILGTQLTVRAALTPGQLGTRQVVAKRRGRHYRVAGEWDLVDHDGRIVGSAWRVGERGEQDKVYRVRLAGLPENPRTYRSLAAAIAAAERALAVQQSR